MNLIFDTSHAFHKSYSIFKSRYPGTELADYESQQKLIRKFLTDFCYSIRLFESIGIDRVICCFDGKNNWRKNVDGEYKGNRSPMPPEFYQVREECKLILKQKGFIIAHDNMLEADDLIAIWSKFISNSGEQCIILSSDGDLRQLADENVCVYSNNSKLAEIYYTEHLDFFSSFRSPLLITYHEVTPNWIVFEKTLLGDKGDNVPKILKKGVGYKRCIELYNQCKPDIDNYEELFNKLSEQDVFDDEIDLKKFMTNHKLVNLINYNGPLNVVKKAYENALVKSMEFDFEGEYQLNDIYDKN